MTEGAFQVIYDQARFLANLNSVELLFWKNDEAEAKKAMRITEPRPFSDRIRNQPFYAGRSSETRLERLGRVCRAMIGGKPSPALFYYPSEDVPRWFELPLSKVDLGIYHYSFAAHWKKSTTRKFEERSACYLHNLESDLFEIRATSERNPLKKVIHQLNARRLKALEGELLKFFDELWFISEADRQDYSRRYGVPTERLRTVPPTFDPEVFSKAKKQRSVSETLTFGFLGKLDFEPNRQGVMWFLKEVAPLLAVGGFNGRVWIGGKNADAELINIGLRFPFVQFNGFVDRLGDWYRNVDVALVPHFRGSGTRIKLLDALSFATPVICHSAAVERIEDSLRTLPEVMVRQSPNDWAETMFNQGQLRKIIDEYDRFPDGLNGQKIYSFLETEALAHQMGKEPKSKVPPLDR